MNIFTILFMRTFSEFFFALLRFSFPVSNHLLKVLKMKKRRTTLSFCWEKSYYKFMSWVSTDIRRNFLAF